MSGTLTVVAMRKGVSRRRSAYAKAFAFATTSLSVLVLVCVVIAGVSLIRSGWHTRAQESPVQGWMMTTGRVTGVHREYAKDGYTYAPIVSFTDARSARYTFSAPLSSDQPSVGEPARVDYDPVDPTRAHDLSASPSGWRAPFVFGVFILAILGLAAMIFIAVAVHVRRRRRRDLAMQPTVSA